MTLTALHYWLITGVLLLLIEGLGLPGAGLLFVGLGSLSVGGLLISGMLAAEDTLLQFVAFFAATALWALILWKPMRRFYSAKNTGGYQNMVGDTAYVGSSGISKHKGGEATWSGTIMKAALAPDAAVERLEAGTSVIISDVKGATLIVKPLVPPSGGVR